jgi:hypothetical protein
MDADLIRKILEGSSEDEAQIAKNKATKEKIDKDDKKSGQ